MMLKDHNNERCTTDINVNKPCQGWDIATIPVTVKEQPPFFLLWHTWGTLPSARLLLSSHQALAILVSKVNARRCVAANDLTCCALVEYALLACDRHDSVIPANIKYGDLMHEVLCCCPRSKELLHSGNLGHTDQSWEASSGARWCPKLQKKLPSIKRKVQSGEVRLTKVGPSFPGTQSINDTHTHQSLIRNFLTNSNSFPPKVFDHRKHSISRISLTL